MFHLIPIIMIDSLISSFVQALQQSFFVYALIVVVLLSVLFPLYGNIVVVRKESNIAHAFAHMWLLGIAVWLRYDIDLQWSIIGSVVVTIILLRFLSFRDRQSFDAINEIIAQWGLIWAILIVSQMTWYRADISSYLFGDILLITQSDVIRLALLTVCAWGAYIRWHQWRYAWALNTEIAHSKGLSSQRVSLLYFVLLGTIIWSAMKIIGVLLVSAFLILPSNIAKLLARDQRQRVRYGIVVSLLCSLFALFFAWYYNLPAWATLVGALIMVYVLTQWVLVFWKSKKSDAN